MRKKLYRSLTHKNEQMLHKPQNIVGHSFRFGETIFHCIPQNLNAHIALQTECEQHSKSRKYFSHLRFSTCLNKILLKHFRLAVEFQKCKKMIVRTFHGREDFL